MNAAAPRTGKPAARRRSTTGSQAAAVGAAVPGAAVRVTGAPMASRRPRSSPSNPFMTDRMVMSAATPTHTPASDSQLLNETKKPASRERT